MRRVILTTTSLAIVACGGKAAPAPTPAPDREVRLLEADDVALRPVLFAVARHLFDPDARRGEGAYEGAFGGVYVNKRQVPSLTKEIARYVNWSSLNTPTPSSNGIKFTSVRIAFDTAYVEVQFAGGGKGRTWCLPYVVDQAAGGWLPVDPSRQFLQKKPSTPGQCGA